MAESDQKSLGSPLCGPASCVDGGGARNLFFPCLRIQPVRVLLSHVREKRLEELRDRNHLQKTRGVLMWPKMFANRPKCTGNSVRKSTRGKRAGLVGGRMSYERTKCTGPSCGQKRIRACSGWNGEKDLGVNPARSTHPDEVSTSSALPTSTHVGILNAQPFTVTHWPQNGCC